MVCYGSRTLLELRVGKTHTIDLLIYLRLRDMGWWYGNISYHQSQLINIIETRVLPKEFEQWVETYCELKKGNQLTNKDGVLLGEGKKMVMKRSMEERKNNVIKKRRKNMPTKFGNRERTTCSRIQLQDKNDQKKTDSNKSNSSLLEIPFLFGESIQIAYRMEDVQISHTGYTLLYPRTKYDSCNQRNSQVTSRSTTKVTKCSHDVKITSNTKVDQFQQMKRISKRILVWCYPFDPSNPMESLSSVEGGSNPGMFPIISLF